METEFTEMIENARKIVAESDAILITAGAGMGVDSGLPDFRGKEGFWKEYPMVKERGLSFESLANPAWFQEEPSLAWAFYGHRLNLYRETIPHEGFRMLLDLCHSKGNDYFILTSNVDGQFQKAGFDPEKVCEIHGSIHHLQCTSSDSHGIWNAEDVNVSVDMKVFKAQSPLPICPTCGSLARPNILMFGDLNWQSKRSDTQMDYFEKWETNIVNDNKKVAIIEIGAGTAIPSIRHMSESVAKQFHTSFIRINPREYQGTNNTISLPFGGAEGIKQILQTQRINQ